MSLLLTLPASASNDDNILIGILHSLSGAMGTSELALKDAVLMLIVDFKSEGRPALSRDRRRLRASEYPAGLNRNPSGYLNTSNMIGAPHRTVAHQP
jgi:hypothetical protein